MPPPAQSREGQEGPGKSAPGTLMGVLGAAASWLRKKGLEKPRLEAEVLLAKVLGVDRLRLYLEFDRPLSEEEKEGFRKLLRERAKGVPSAYLVGEKEFHSLAFHVDPRVLIPRPETETLLEAALEVSVPVGEEGLFADVGTGSGCLAVGFLVERPGWRGWATDLSGPALEVAGENAKRHGVAQRIRFFRGDLLEPLRGEAAQGSLDLVFSNPPYVEKGDPALDPRVARFEPAGALFPGPEGVEGLWKRLLGQSLFFLGPGGWLLLECAPSQAERLARVFAEHPSWKAPRTWSDLAGRPRVVGAQVAEST